eukprot:scaffold12558_cov159-Amphora_coffeaeformis.AAC.1
MGRVGAGGDEEAGGVSGWRPMAVWPSSTGSTSLAGVDWRSNRGARKWAGAILRGRTNVVDRKGVFRAGGRRARKGVGLRAVWPSSTASTSTRKGSSAGAGWVKAVGKGLKEEEEEEEEETVRRPIPSRQVTVGFRLLVIGRSRRWSVTKAATGITLIGLADTISHCQS